MNVLYGGIAWARKRKMICTSNPILKNLQIYNDFKSIVPGMNSYSLSTVSSLERCSRLFKNDSGSKLIAPGICY